MTDKLWQPSEERIANANLTRFMQSLGFSDYGDLYRWSIDHPEEFWEKVWTFGEVKASQTWDHVLVDKDKMPGAKWFTGAKLNFAENLLRFRDDKIAIIFNRAVW